MTQAEIRDFKVGLLDMVHDQFTDPVPDIRAIRDMVEESLSKLEASIDGKKG